MARVSVGIVGDLMLTQPVSGAGLSGAFDARPFEILNGCQVVVGNVEQVLSDRGYPADKAARLKGPPAVAHEIRRLGFEVGFLANNHAMDFGYDGLLDTVAALGEAGVLTCGAGRDLDEAMRHVVWDAEDGTRVAFLSFASTLPPGSPATPSRPGIAPIRVRQSYVVDSAMAEEQPGYSPYVLTECIEEDVHRAEQAVRTARAEADVVVVALHWGVPFGWLAPFQGPLADYQRPLGHRIVEAGADLIAGTHAHTVHGVEFHRHGAILYSLGNFLFHPFERPTGAEKRPEPPYNRGPMHGPTFKQSVFATCRLGSGDPEIRLHPVQLDDQGHPTLCSDEVAREILGRIAEHTRQLDPTVTVAEDGSIGRVR